MTLQLETLPHIEDINSQNAFGWNRSDRIALFAAHPDDIEVMMGHAAMLALATGAQTHAYVASAGEASTRGDREFVRSGGRKFETLSGLGHLGLKLENVYISNLPDGELGDQDYFELLVDDVGYFVDSRGLTGAVTLGNNGGDGASLDHRAVHEAVMEAAGQQTRVWGLNSEHEGSLSVEPDQVAQETKFGAIGFNWSQFPIVRIDGREMPPDHVDIGSGFAAPVETAKILRHYLPLMTRETYDEYQLYNKNPIFKDGP
jgi:LmbE family N-acetylglucosaminyl deacetylase